MTPHFLVIGGQKCGSTTLYRDLAATTGVALAEKELNLLSRPGLDAERIRAEYARAFRHAPPDALRGDVSTTYAMLPDVAGVAERAKRALPPTTKIVYVVRDPVRRAISHHHHMRTQPDGVRWTEPIDQSLDRRPELVDHGRYAMQLAPWRDAFGADAIRVIRFEQYVRDRVGVLSELCRFLGAAPPEGIDAGKVHNRSAGKPALNRFWAGLSESGWYRRVVRPLLPDTAKAWAMRLLLPQAPAAYDPPSQSTVDRIRERTRGDERVLRELLGATEPLWEGYPTERSVAA